VGTPKGRLGILENELLALDWQQAREGVDVKLLPRSGELYVLARSKDRVAKERAVGMTVDSSIVELGLDSLERMEIIASLEDAGQTAFIVERVRAGIAEDRRLAGRLALWGRRLMGEALTQA